MAGTVTLSESNESKGLSEYPQIPQIPQIHGVRFTVHGARTDNRR
jgi:hypothetical protein